METLPRKKKRQGSPKWRPADRVMIALTVLGLIVAIVAAIAAWM
ncbi:hypothetical protein [Streptomyces tirandamycinicus]|nr:hypothetical protein [Streptomyces tirandamycinicus]